MSRTTFLRHNRVSLALHELEQRPGPALLLLHGLGERSPERLPAELAGWPGPVFALDFTGHGASTLPAGGGYTAEVLMADADAALAHLGAVTLLGRGLGAYVALMLAGGRPKAVRGAILCDGPGLDGGTPEPGAPDVTLPDPALVGPPDPFALAELAHDVRPPDYAASFARQASRLSGLAQPVAVCARARPAWLAAALAEPGVTVTGLDAALAQHARAAVGGQ
ncbi:MAG TPA: alpha/beta hydrolase [Myxococcota bacterium]|nr:alpha/beta hydrolase [Myxococcota bacterium]